MTTKTNMKMRHEWVKRVTLPMNEGGYRPGLFDLPTSLHPSIDPYLTVKERQELMAKFGWIKVVNDKYCYLSSLPYMNVQISNYLDEASYMNEVKDEMKVYNTGESYF